MNTPKFLFRYLSILVLLLPTLNAMAGNEFTADEVAGSADVRDLDSPPKPKSQSAPNVPPNLRSLQASVFVGFLIDENGKVVSPRIVKSSNEQFDNIAMDCVRDWRFEPGRQGGKAVKVRVIVPLRFK